MSRDHGFLAPDWGAAEEVHDWRNYVSDEVRAIWDTFTPEQRIILGRMFDEMGGREEWD